MVLLLLKWDFFFSVHEEKLRTKANNSPHIVVDSDTVTRGRRVFPSSFQQSKLDGLLQVHVILATVKCWPAFGGSVRPMCIFVSFVRHSNMSSV